MTEGRSSRVCCSLCGRLVFLLLGALAMVSSVFAIYSCEFFSYRTLDGNLWGGFEKPFDQLRKASVGLFSYSESTSYDGFLLFGDQCVDYEDWTEVGQHILFNVAQWCSIFAPVAGFLAWFQILCESLFCRLRGSYFLVITFFVFAALLQGCTFLVFADTQFCFDAASQNQCSLQTGAWYSVGSVAGYLLLAIISTANKSTNAKSTKCGGCCIMTRGPDSLVFDEENQKDHNSDTSDDGLWNTDEDGEDDVSAVNWAVAGDTVGSNRSGGSNRSSPQSSTGRDGDLLFTDTSADTDDLDAALNTPTTQDSKLLDSYVEEEPKINKSISRKTPSQDSMIRERRSDYFDAMCCGDPLEVEKYLKKSTRASKSDKKKKRKSDSRTSYQQSGEGGILSGIPVV